MVLRMAVLVFAIVRVRVNEIVIGIVCESVLVLGFVIWLCDWVCACECDCDCVLLSWYCV